jgi:hypothetical protein
MVLRKASFLGASGLLLGLPGCSDDGPTYVERDDLLSEADDAMAKFYCDSALELYEDTTTAARFCRAELVPTATDQVSCQRALADCTNHYDPDRAREAWSCDHVTAETFDCDVLVGDYVGCLRYFFATYRAELSCARLPPPDLAESYPHCAEFLNECPDAARLVKLIPDGD